jgi:hypothetical protein
MAEAAVSDLANHELHDPDHDKKSGEDFKLGNTHASSSATKRIDSKLIPLITEEIL